MPYKNTGSTEDDYTSKLVYRQVKCAHSLQPPFPAANWRLQRLKGMKAPHRVLPMGYAKSADSPNANMKAKSLSIQVPRATSLAVLPDNVQCSSPDSEITFTASPMQEHHTYCPPTPGLNDQKPNVVTQRINIPLTSLTK